MCVRANHRQKIQIFKIYILLLKASENYFIDIFRLVGPSRTGKTIKCINICFLGHLSVQRTLADVNDPSTVCCTFVDPNELPLY